MLRLLKRHLPASEIFWWIDSNYAPLLEGDPDLAGIVRFERRRWAMPFHWPEMFSSIRWMRAQNFDWIIDLQCLARSGAFAWLANGQFLIGLDEPREGARGFYDIAVRRRSFHTHAADWYLAVLPQLGVPVHNNFQWLPERPEITAAVKSKWQTGGARWIAIQPGARWPTKRWPAEYFAEITRRLAAKFSDARFAVLGVAGDKPLGEIISQAAPTRTLNLCGRTSLPEMIEWLRLSELMVTNDTGPMHAAAALGTPLVALSAPPSRAAPAPMASLKTYSASNCPARPA